MTTSSIGAAKGGGYARYLEGKTIPPERGDYYLTPGGEPVQAQGRWLAPEDTLGEAAEEGEAEQQIDLAEECYLDLRRITSIRRGALEQLEREAAMNEDGRLMLQEHLFRFFTRRLLPDDWREWESEE
jgi:hypothetical protein